VLSRCLFLDFFCLQLVKYMFIVHLFKKLNSVKPHMHYANFIISIFTKYLNSIIFHYNPLYVTII
jgi:hypothetical protein